MCLILFLLSSDSNLFIIIIIFLSYIILFSFVIAVIKLNLHHYLSFLILFLYLLQQLLHLLLVFLFSAIFLGSFRMPYQEIRRMIVEVDEEQLTEPMIQVRQKYLDLQVHTWHLTAYLLCPCKHIWNRTNIGKMLNLKSASVFLSVAQTHTSTLLCCLD